MYVIAVCCQELVFVLCLCLKSHQQLRSYGDRDCWESNLRPLVYKASGLSTTPRQLKVLVLNIVAGKELLVGIVLGKKLYLNVSDLAGYYRSFFECFALVRVLVL